MDDLRERAIAILRQNDRGGYSVPTDGLYPFQWNWDAGFAAMGYGCFDEVRGWRELQRLLQGQWPDGMVPHIVFHREDPRYFPGPEVWATVREPRTSGITQPPILAVCARRLFERARDGAAAAAAVRQLFPKLLAYHRWYHTARDPEGTGLVALYHPWETGMDNSSAWDGPLARVPVDPLPAYERRDTDHVDASQRPRRAEYDRYLTLVYRFRARAWEPRASLPRARFASPTSASTASCSAPIRICSPWRRSLASRRAGTSSRAGSRAATRLCRVYGRIRPATIARATSSPARCWRLPPRQVFYRCSRTLRRPSARPRWVRLWSAGPRRCVSSCPAPTRRVRCSSPAATGGAGVADRELDDRGRARCSRTRRSRGSAARGRPGAGPTPRLLRVLRPHQRRRSGRRQLHLDRRHHAVLVAVAAMQR